jgi:hypothetical protein
MKKLILLAGSAFILGFVFTSCRKCETCTAYYKVDNQVYYQDHLCDMSPSVKTWETDFKSTYDWGDYYVECKKD